VDSFINLSNLLVGLLPLMIALHACAEHMNSDQFVAQNKR